MGPVMKEGMGKGTSFRERGGKGREVLEAAGKDVPTGQDLGGSGWISSLGFFFFPV